MDLKNIYTEAISLFLRQEINQDTISIFVSGSYILNKLKPNSDVDIFIATNHDYSQAVAKYFNNIEFECCYKPVEYFYKDLEEKKPFDIQRYSMAQTLYDPTNEGQKIIDKAKEIFNKGPRTPITDSDKYHLEDNFKDLADSLNEVEFSIILYKCFSNLLKFYFKRNNLWEYKEKYIYDYLSSIDVHFSNLIKSFLIENDPALKYKKILGLKEYVTIDMQPLDINWESPKFYRI